MNGNEYASILDVPCLNYPEYALLTVNASGSVNSVMYNKTITTGRQIGITSMHQLVQQSNQLTEMAVLDRGECRFRTNYKHLQVDPHDRQTERATSSKCCFSPGSTATGLAYAFSLQYSPLSVTPEEANLAHIPLGTARRIWRKENELLTTQSVIVTSRSSTKPCVVICKSQGMLS